MMAFRTRLLMALVILVLASSPAAAQSTNNKLVFLLPDLFGPNGLQLPNPFHQAHFDSSFQSSFAPLNSSVGSQLAILPLASPASGILYTFDRSLGVATRSTQSFGPLLVERAETIGRRKLFVGFTYQFFKFSSVDGENLKDLPAVFTHLDLNPPSPGVPTFERDIITTHNNIELRTHQFTMFATYGITSRIDVSVAVPISRVSMKIRSDAQIVSNSFCCPHFFDVANPTGSSLHTFSDSGSASGIGDVTFRVKGTAWKGERGGVGFGLDVRTPTGDELNFLGSGSVGVKPFFIWSYASRFSPHVNVGYEWNGDSVLAGNVSTGAKGSLPNQFFYSGGVDVGVNKYYSIAVDLMSQVIINGPRVVRTTFTDFAGVNYPNLMQQTESYSINSAAIGLKINPTRNLLISGNALVKLNAGGLRAKVVPLVGLSYTF